MKKVLLSLEALIILIPLGCFIIYMSALQLIFGVPAHLFRESTEFSPELFLAFIGNLAGLFAYWVLIELSYKTINGREISFDKRLNLALFCGSFACAVLYFIYDFWLASYVVIPSVVITFHFIYLQFKCKKYA
ncbi:hypothetical protein [Pseudoalteromonas sp. T1lg48]|uniref:hypothetical protein n=1 Tax=Pseudoalteromonas sp. T1lg48 TaxID=2077100 RepID=UPI000CF66F6D|nr:hypothetical protein [Pseudoalteromonas sp. T1lg48]